MQSRHDSPFATIYLVAPWILFELAGPYLQPSDGAGHDEESEFFYVFKEAVLVKSGTSTHMKF